MWLKFLGSFNGKSIFYKQTITDSNSNNLYSDPSRKGFGGTYGTYWLQGSWPESWKNLNIAFLELYHILLLLKMFGYKMANSNILFHCDNMAIVQLINKQTSRDMTIMMLLRPLVLALLSHNIQFRSQHLNSADNYLDDAVSQFQETPEILQSAGLHSHRTHIPHLLLPGSYKL